MKNQKPDHARISCTAVMCAKSLAEDSDVPYAKEIWQKLEKYDEQVVRDGNNFAGGFFKKVITSLPGISGLRAILEGRYVAVNNVLENEGNPHVIELASGLSPRGLDFTRRNPNQVYIETDLPELQEIKKQIVEQIRKNESLESLASTPNYHLTPLNVLDKHQFMEAVKPYVNSARDKPLAIVHTGLWMYLDLDEQKNARDNIAEVLNTYSPNGMWITPDLNAKEFIKYPIIGKLVMRRIEKKTGRKFTLYETDEEVKNFVAEGGFKREVVPSDYLADSLSCVKYLGLDVESVRQKSSKYNVHKMKLF